MASDSFDEPPSTTKKYFDTMIAKQVYFENSKKPKMAILFIFILCVLLLFSVKPFDLNKTALIGTVFLIFSLSMKVHLERDKKIPFAVNFNHPLMSDEPMGQAQVFVWLEADIKWVLLQESRVRLVDNTLFGGVDLVYDDEEYTRIGHYSISNKITTQIKRSLALLNQAIVLSELSNQDDADESSNTDDIERRKREKQDSDLLQRSWLEEESEIEVEGPLAKFINRE